MSRVARKRKAKIANWLAELAEKNPKKFTFEWRKRLDSAVDVIWQLARNGRLDEPTTASIADELIAKLNAYGPAAERLVLEATARTLENEVVKAIAAMAKKSASSAERQHRMPELARLNMSYEKKQL